MPNTSVYCVAEISTEVIVLTSKPQANTQHSPGSGGRCMANGAIQLTAVYSHGCMNRIQLRAVGSSSGDMLLLIVGRINSTVGQLLHIAPLTFKTTPPYSNAIFDNTCFTVTALPPSRYARCRGNGNTKWTSRCVSRSPKRQHGLNPPSLSSHETTPQTCNAGKR